MFDLPTTTPAIATLDRFNLKVTSLTPGAEFWALISVTDQETQQVVLITGQEFSK